jgi:mannose-6-phosphate isomerase-like protein (cupin superfamily)
VTLIRLQDLPWSEIAHELVGADHDLDVTILFVDAEPGRGPALHRHPYAELFIVQEGEATFTLGEETVQARPGDILVAWPDQPHAFVNSGSGPLHQIDIHLSPSFSTEWLDASDG